MLSVAWQPLYWLSSTIYNQSCFSSTTVWMQQTGVSKAICTVSSTKSTSTVMIVVLPRLPVLQMPAIFLVDTTQSIGNCELLYTVPQGVTQLQHQTSDHREVTAITVNMLHTELIWTPTAGGYFFTHFAHTQGNWTNYEQTLLASNACIHLKHSACLLCHMYSSLDIQSFKSVTFPQSNTAQWQCISFLAKTFME